MIYQFNEFGICINAKQTIITRGNGYQYIIETALHENKGWTFGYNLSYNTAKTGIGGEGFGCGFLDYYDADEDKVIERAKKTVNQSLRKLGLIKEEAQKTLF